MTETKKDRVSGPFGLEIKGSAGSMGTVKKATRCIKIKAPLGKQVSKH